MCWAVLVLREEIAHGLVDLSVANSFRLQQATESDAGNNGADVDEAALVVNLLASSLLAFRHGRERMYLGACRSSVLAAGSGLLALAVEDVADSGTDNV
jgi:hypothetical protein